MKKTSRSGNLLSEIVIFIKNTAWKNNKIWISETMRNRPVVCCLVVLSIFLATIALIAIIENDRRFLQFGAGICLFGLFFVIKNFTAASIIRAAFIGVVYSCSWEVPEPLDSFIIIVSIFHLGTLPWFQSPFSNHICRWIHRSGTFKSRPAQIRLFLA